MMYQLTNPIRNTSHHPSPITHHISMCFRDIDDKDDDDLKRLIVEARLRSGDYFVTLATECEQMATTLRAQGAPEADYLDTIADELTYLDSVYMLRPRN